ncbi:hypothetical protein [Nocardiopsis sp. Huas11]|uniref:hypothetical protein n=1 Tax=Nocardiopsis sp. Huas11 TaxID=2183912 RepID=UPI001F2A1B2B|nr:hypothetical protein [Nocardiopsis sp. Huas11]
MQLPPPPPWRAFGGEPWMAPRPEDKESERLLGAVPPVDAVPPQGSERRTLIDKVNASLLLRRPLLLVGAPGSGKPSPAHQIFREQGLGRVLRWSVNSRSTVTSALYEYDPLTQVHDLNLENARRRAFGTDDRRYAEGGDDGARLRDSARSIGRYLRLGPLGTAFYDLADDLVDLFENGGYRIPELARLAGAADTIDAGTDDPDTVVPVTRGRVECSAFPVVGIACGSARELPPSFLRACLPVRVAPPGEEELTSIVAGHFGEYAPNVATDIVQEFLRLGAEGEPPAIDQLLNAVQLVSEVNNASSATSPDQVRHLSEMLWHRLRDDRGAPGTVRRITERGGRPVGLGCSASPVRPVRRTWPTPSTSSHCARSARAGRHRRARETRGKRRRGSDPPHARNRVRVRDLFCGLHAVVRNWSTDRPCSPRFALSTSGKPAGPGEELDLRGVARGYAAALLESRYRTPEERTGSAVEIPAATRPVERRVTDVTLLVDTGASMVFHQGVVEGFVHLLHPRLWRRSGLSPFPARLRAPWGAQPGHPNTRYLAKGADGAPLPEGTTFPVFSLKANALRDWAVFVMGRNTEELWTPVTVFSGRMASPVPEGEAVEDAAALVSGFQRTASPETFELAVVLAAVPLEPEPVPTELAEFFFGGLLGTEPTGTEPHGEPAPGAVTWEFRPGVRRRLLALGGRVPEIAEELGDLPLALNQAAVWLNEVGSRSRLRAALAFLCS